jgi:hypothetical protein
MDADEIEESGILPRPAKTSSEEYKHPKPHNLIVNEALRHFWEQYFPEKQYVRWTTFLNKLENHLSSPRQKSTGASPAKGSKQPKSLYPVAPNGYGLHQNELYALFRERDGKRNLMKSVQYALDLENTGVLSGTPTVCCVGSRVRFRLLCYACYATRYSPHCSNRCLRAILVFLLQPQCTKSRWW